MIRELPALWHEPFGYEPLPAGTFSDIEASAGTCCQASDWIPLGKTKATHASAPTSTCRMIDRNNG